MERASTDEGVLEYETWGTGEPVLFIHGAFIADTFRPLLSQRGLAGRYRLIVYHRRGYAGSSRLLGPISVAQHAADCRDLLGALSIERAHVVGHSYGGVVALQLALDAPAAVHSLALLEPALMAGTSGEGYRQSLLRATERNRKVGTATAVHEFLQARWPGYDPALERVLPGCLAQAMADAETCFEQELPGLLEWRFDKPEASRITQPVLSVLGGESEALSARFGETHRLLLEWLPNAEGAVLPGTTHFMQLQDARATAEVLADFWAHHPGALG